MAEPEAEAELEPEPEAAAPEPEAEPEPTEAEPEAGPEPEPEADVAPEAAAPEPEPEAEAEAEPEADPEAEPAEAEPEPEAEAEPDAAMVSPEPWIPILCKSAVCTCKAGCEHACKHGCTCTQGQLPTSLCVQAEKSEYTADQPDLAEDDEPAHEDSYGADEHEEVADPEVSNCVTLSVAYSYSIGSPIVLCECCMAHWHQPPSMSNSACCTAKTADTPRPHLICLLPHHSPSPSLHKRISPLPHTGCPTRDRARCRGSRGRA